MSQDNPKGATESGSFDPLELSKQLDGESLSWKKSEKQPSVVSNQEPGTTTPTETEKLTMSETKPAPGMAGVNKVKPLLNNESVAAKVDPAEVEALASQLAARDRVKDHTFLSNEEIAARAERSKDRKLVPNIEIAKEAKKDKGPKKGKNDGMIPTVATGKDAFFRKKKSAKGIGSRIIPALLISSGVVLVSGNIALMGLLYYGHSEQIHSVINAVVEGKGVAGVSSAMAPRESKVTQTEPVEPYEFPPVYVFDSEAEEESTATAEGNRPKAEVSPGEQLANVEAKPVPIQNRTQDPSPDWLDQAKDGASYAWGQVVNTAEQAWHAVSGFSKSVFQSALALFDEAEMEVKAEAAKPAAAQVSTPAEALNPVDQTINASESIEQPTPSVETVATITNEPKIVAAEVSVESPNPAPQAKPEPAEEVVSVQQSKVCSIANNVDQKFFVTVEDKLSKRSVDANVLRKHEIATSYLVYLPKELASSDEQVDALKSKGVTDSHKIRVAGPLNGALSLGLFSTEASAKKQQQILEQKGIVGTKVGPRTTVAVLDVKLTGASSQLEVAKGMLSSSSQRISFSNCQSNVASSEGNIELSSR